MDNAVTVIEMGPRDGLQNEPTILPTSAKLAMIAGLVEAGARRIEAVSFAHPRLVPAMADAEAVMDGVERRDDVSYAGLVLNERGLSRALATGVDEVNVVVCVSETFAQRNQNSSTAEQIRVAASVVAGAKEAGLLTTVTLSTCFGCPFEGEVDPGRVLDVALECVTTGAHEIAFADTIGVGVPAQVRHLAREFTRQVPPPSGVLPTLRFHFHDTRHTGVANALAAYEEGVRLLDASVGGLGGCPFAPGATGNIATEDLAYALHRSGAPTGLDVDVLRRVATEAQDRLGRPLPSAVLRAGGFPNIL